MGYRLSDHHICRYYQPLHWWHLLFVVNCFLASTSLIKEDYYAPVIWLTDIHLGKEFYNLSFSCVFFFFHPFPFPPFPSFSLVDVHSQ